MSHLHKLSIANLYEVILFEPFTVPYEAFKGYPLACPTLVMY